MNIEEMDRYYEKGDYPGYQKLVRMDGPEPPDIRDASEIKHHELCEVGIDIKAGGDGEDYICDCKELYEIDKICAAEDRFDLDREDAACG